MGYVGDGPKPQLEVGDISTKDVTATGDLTVDTNTLYVDSTNNNVGIGTVSPDATGLHVHTGSAGSLTPNSAADDLVVESNGNAGITIASPDANYSGIIFSSPTDTTGSIIEYNQSGATFDIGTATSSGVLRLRSGNFSEAARLDSSGRLLVGKTTNAIGTAGHTLQADGFFSATRSAAYAAGFNRLSDDGQIVQFFKDGSSVGSIGSNSNRLQIQSGSGGDLILGTGSNADAYRLSDAVIYPSVGDATVDLGLSNRRFKDLYLSGGAYLGGTGSANYLDDYEEGTWTPTNAGDSTGTISGASAGQYTKIGRFVHVQGQINITANFAGNSIGGLPFTPRIQSGLSNVYGAFVGATTIGAIYMAVTDAGTNINLYSNAVNTGLSPSTSYGTIRFAITYETNA